MEERGLGKGLTVAPYPGTGDPEASLVCCSSPWARALSPHLGDVQGPLAPGGTQSPILQSAGCVASGMSRQDPTVPRRAAEPPPL